MKKLVLILLLLGCGPDEEELRAAAMAWGQMASSDDPVVMADVVDEEACLVIAAHKSGKTTQLVCTVKLCAVTTGGSRTKAVYVPIYTGGK